MSALTSKPARELRPGDRFIFTDAMGGEGEVLTVEAVHDLYGVAVIETEEYQDCTIEWPSGSIVPVCLCPASADVLSGGKDFTLHCTLPQGHEGRHADGDYGWWDD